MTRLNLILYFVLILTSLGVVNSQDRARKLYFELEQQEEFAKKMNVEYGQLQLEQSTWSMHSRIEDIAESKLHMQVPDAVRIQVISPDMPAVPKVQLESANVTDAKVEVSDGVAK